LSRAVEARLAPPFYRRTLTLTPSEATREELLHLGFRPNRVVAVNNGVDEMFRPGGRPSPSPLVVCVGRLAPVKRQDELIEAAVIARRRLPDLQLVIVGDGPLRPSLEARVAAHGAGDWITLAGRLSHADLVALYQRAWLVSLEFAVPGVEAWASLQHAGRRTVWIYRLPGAGADSQPAPRRADKAGMPAPSPAVPAGG